MRVKFKIAKKTFFELVNYYANQKPDLYNIEYIDKINMRELYMDTLSKNERWRHEPTYYKAKKEFTISIEVNKYFTMEKLFFQMTSESYEHSCMLLIFNQVTPQIRNYLAINQNLIML